jgi:hypothetical protein
LSVWNTDLNERSILLITLPNALFIARHLLAARS